MAVSAKASNSGAFIFAFAALCVGGTQTAACTPPFHSCYETRTCPPKPKDEAGAAGDESGAGAGGQEEDNGGTAGRTGNADAGAPVGGGGSAGAEPDPATAGAAGMSDDSCGGTSCSGDTPVCKVSGTSSLCVACLGNDDCRNGGTCNSANVCVCSARFNGKHCEFQVFRSVGTLQGDTTSSVTCISHDGSVIAGISGSLPAHAFRSINGGSLEFIAEPTTLTPSVGCRPKAVANSGAVLLDCEGKSFLYTTADGTVAADLPTNGYLADLSSDGKVLVGNVASQGLRKVGSTNTLLGPLQPNSGTTFVATSADGTVVVGRDTTAVGVRWTAATGLVALEKLSGWNYYSATDVSADGGVIVGSVDPATTALAVKWSGPMFKPTVLGVGQANGVSGDGSVVVGTDSEVQTALIFDSTGARDLRQLIADTGTPDLGSSNMQVARSISDDAKFVVGETSPTGVGWVVHLP